MSSHRFLPPPPPPLHPRIHAAGSSGVVVAHAGTRGRLEGCVIAGNGNGGVSVQELAHPTVIGCQIHDHATGNAAGVVVHATARGMAALGAGNVMFRNLMGDVVRL